MTPLQVLFRKLLIFLLLFIPMILLLILFFYFPLLTFIAIVAAMAFLGQIPE